MTTLTGFLLARIAEEEEAARIAATVPEAAMNITRWHPARVLAECEGKRQIVDMCRPLYAVAYSEAERQRAIAAGEDSIRVYAQSDPVWPHSTAEQILRALALPYADHPDCDPEWRP